MSFSQPTMSMGAKLDIIAAAQANESFSTIAARMNVSVGSVHSVVRAQDEILTDAFRTTLAVWRNDDGLPQHNNGGNPFAGGNNQQGGRF